MSCTNQKLCYQIVPDKQVYFVSYVSGYDLDFNSFKFTYNFPKGTDISKVKVFLVPCGQCVQCRLERSREMANRIMLESQYYQDNWAITLTYDDDHLPFGRTVCSGSGDFREYPTLVPSDVQSFMKLIRQEFSRKFNHTGIKFYLCGEYGEKYGRPHFHLILFNFPLPADDVSLCRESSQCGEDLFESQIVSRIWGKGRVRLNSLSWQYAAYVARYIMKKQTGKGADIYDTLGIVPPFTRCSTREGLGKRYYLDHKFDLLKSDQILLKQGSKVLSVSLPKYFLRLAESEGFSLDDLKKSRRIKARRSINRVLSSISEDYFDYLHNIENFSDKNRIKGLPRVDF